MLDLWAVLFPILLADIVNPVLFAFLVYATASERPILNSSALLLGHTVAYFVVGIVVALGLERISSYLANPSFIDYVIGLIIGLLLLWVAVSSAKKSKQKRPEQSGSLSPVSAFSLGAVVNLVGAPFALPYFAAIDQILKANLITVEVLSLIVAYNILYALPFSVVPTLVAILGERGLPLLQRINNWLDRVSTFLMPIILGLVGLALVADALLYFATGKGLF